MKLQALDASLVVQVVRVDPRGDDRDPGLAVFLRVLDLGAELQRLDHLAVLLRLKTVYVEKLPIAPPTDEAQAEDAVGHLLSITRSGQEARRDVLDWLQLEYGVEKSGQKLEVFARLEPDAFVEEVRKRRPKSDGPLTPAGLKALRTGYEETAVPVRESRAKATRLEGRLRSPSTPPTASRPGRWT